MPLFSEIEKSSSRKNEDFILSLLILQLLYFVVVNSIIDERGNSFPRTLWLLRTCCGLDHTAKYQISSCRDYCSAGARLQMIGNRHQKAGSIMHMEHSVCVNTRSASHMEVLPPSTAALLAL